MKKGFYRFQRGDYSVREMREYIAAHDRMDPPKWEDYEPAVSAGPTGDIDRIRRVAGVHLVLE